MKTKIFILMFAIIASIGSLSAESGTCGENLTWELSNGTLTISGTGAMMDYLDKSEVPWDANRESILTAVISVGVTTIGDYAFYNCYNLTSVIIPNSVTNIGNNAFNYCTGLTSVTIPNNVTNIDIDAFSNCSSLEEVTINANEIISKNYTASFSITNIFGWQVNSYILGDSIKSVGERAFVGCSKLTSVTIPYRVTSIGTAAFSGCQKLSLHFNGTIEDWCTKQWNLSSASLSYDLYIGDEKLVDCIIPNSVTSIGDYAFCCCRSLTSVTIPNSVTSIGTWAFNSCTGLTSIEIPNSVTSIGERAFYYCTGLTSVTIPNNVASIESNTFYRCSALTSVTIPNSVTSIGSYAFAYCSSLTSVTIPNSVTSIGNYAFEWCTGLTSVTIPNSATSIGRYPFNGCTSLTSVIIEATTPPTLFEPSHTFPDSIPIYVPCGTLETYQSAWSVYFNQIKYALRPYTIQLSGISEHGNVEISEYRTICDDLPKLTAIADTGCHFVQWNDGNTDNPRTIELTQDTTIYAIFAVDKSGVCGDENLLRWKYTDDGTLTISGEGTLNSNYTFGIEAPTGMKSLIVKDGVTSIGDNAFAGKQLASIDLPQSLTSIGKHAFSDNNVLKKIIIPNNVTTIGIGAFKNGNRLQEIVLGEGVETIGDSAFNNCPYLIAIHAQMEYPPVISTSVFANCGDLSGIDCYVPQESLAFYKKTAVWKEFNLIVGEKLFSIIALPYNAQLGSVTGTGAYAAGVEVTMTATPKAGYHFTCWNDGNKDNPRTIVVACDATYTALFAADAPTGDEAVQVTTTDEGATITTGKVDDNEVDSYSLAICQDGDTICVLTLDAEGRLTGINFRSAPPRHMPQQTTVDAGGLNIPVTGLEPGTTYQYTLDALDKDKNILDRREGEFTTDGEAPEAIDSVNSSNNLDSSAYKILRDGQIYVLRGEKVYTLQGQEIK